MIITIFQFLIAASGYHFGQLMSISLPHIWPKPPGVSQICSQQREFKGRGTEPQVIYRFPNSNPKNFSNFPDQICSFFSTRLIIIAMCIHWVSNLCYCIWLVREVKWLARGHTTKCLVQVLKPSFFDSNTHATFLPWHGQGHSPSIRNAKLQWCLSLHLVHLSWLWPH